MKKFSFIHIPKNAGTSFRALIVGDHAPLKNYIKFVGHVAPSKCFAKDTKRIIVFREPGRRFCSAFYYRLSRSPACREWAKVEGIDSPNKYIKYLISTKQRWNPIMSLRADCQSVAGIPIAPTVWVFQPQSLWFRSPNSILLQENLDAEWEFFCDSNAIPFVDLPRENISDNSLILHASTLGDESVSFLRHVYSGDYALWDLLQNMCLEDRVQMP